MEFILEDKLSGLLYTREVEERRISVGVRDGDGIHSVGQALRFAIY